MDKASFGTRVRNARRKSGLSSDALAELCDCTPVSIRQIESGVRLPSLPKLVDICNALHVTPNELLGQELLFSPSVRENPDQRMVEALIRLHGLSPDKGDAVCTILETLVSQMEGLE